MRKSRRIGQPPSLRVRGPLALLAVAVLGIAVAHGSPIDLKPFVGNWTLESGSKIQLTCSGLSLSTDLPSSVVSITPGTTSDLEFHLACHCTLPLNIVGSQARLAAPTYCSFVLVTYQIVTTVTDLTFDLSSPVPSLTITGPEGEALARPALPGTGPCADFGITGTVHRASSTPIDCGPDDTAVGILPSWKEGNIDCGIDVGRECVDILLNSDNNLTCLGETGARGEGKWVLPQAQRYDQMCSRVSAPNSNKPNLVNLPFCRVDGRQFKPLTTDATATDQSYAVLMLGTQCPNGSVEVVWGLDTPEVNDASSCAGAAPERPCGPNQAIDLGGGASTFYMHFCLFRAAASADGVMSAFPEIGKGYSVFHAFDAKQPPWVIHKRWIYSQHGLGNRVSGADEDANRQLSAIVEETSDHGIYFEMARVR